MSSLGDTLRERRTRLGVSLDQAEAATRIRSRTLEALENGEHALLPDAGYVRGFISSYARFLELDPAPLLQMYKAETGNKRHLDLHLPQVNEAVKPSGQQHAVPWQAAVAIVAVIVVVSGVIWGITRIWRGPEPTPPVPVTPQGTSATIEPTKTPVVTSSTTAPEKGLPFTVDVSVDSDAASWVRVTIDGKKAYEGTLTGGQSKRFEASRSATVRVGKPSVVTIMKDGAKVAIPAGDTPTVTLQSTPQN